MLFAFVIMNWPENKSRRVFKKVCRMIGWSLLRQNLLPGRLAVKWNRSKTVRSLKDSQKARASGFVSVRSTLWP